MRGIAPGIHSVPVAHFLRRLSFALALCRVGRTGVVTHATRRRTRSRVVGTHCAVVAAPAQCGVCNCRNASRGAAARLADRCGSPLRPSVQWCRLAGGAQKVSGAGHCCEKRRGDVPGAESDGARAEGFAYARRDAARKCGLPPLCHACIRAYLSVIDDQLLVIDVDPDLRPPRGVRKGDVVVAIDSRQFDAVFLRPHAIFR